MSCYCNNLYCESCGPNQGNFRCPSCRAWSANGGCNANLYCETRNQLIDAINRRDDLLAEGKAAADVSEEIASIITQLIEIAGEYNIHEDKLVDLAQTLCEAEGDDEGDELLSPSDREPPAPMRRKRKGASGSSGKAAPPPEGELKAAKPRKPRKPKKPKKPALPPAPTPIPGADIGATVAVSAQPQRGRPKINIGDVDVTAPGLPSTVPPPIPSGTGTAAALGATKGAQRGGLGGIYGKMLAVNASANYVQVVTDAEGNETTKPLLSQGDMIIRASGFTTAKGGIVYNVATRMRKPRSVKYEVVQKRGPVNRERAEIVVQATKKYFGELNATVDSIYDRLKTETTPCSCEGETDCDICKGTGDVRLFDIKRNRTLYSAARHELLVADLTEHKRNAMSMSKKEYAEGLARFEARIHRYNERLRVVEELYNMNIDEEMSPIKQISEGEYQLGPVRVMLGDKRISIKDEPVVQEVGAGEERGGVKIRIGSRVLDDDEFEMLAAMVDAPLDESRTGSLFDGIQDELRKKLSIANNAFHNAAQTGDKRKMHSVLAQIDELTTSLLQFDPDSDDQINSEMSMLGQIAAGEDERSQQILGDITNVQTACEDLKRYLEARDVQNILTDRNLELPEKQQRTIEGLKDAKARIYSFLQNLLALEGRVQDHFKGASLNKILKLIGAESNVQEEIYLEDIRDTVKNLMAKIDPAKFDDKLRLLARFGLGRDTEQLRQGALTPRPTAAELMKTAGEKGELFTEPEKAATPRSDLPPEGIMTPTSMRVSDGSVDTAERNPAEVAEMTQSFVQLAGEAYAYLRQVLSFIGANPWDKSKDINKYFELRKNLFSKISLAVPNDYRKGYRRLRAILNASYNRVNEQMKGIYKSVRTVQYDPSNSQGMTAIRQLTMPQVGADPCDTCGGVKKARCAKCLGTGREIVQQEPVEVTILRRSTGQPEVVRAKYIGKFDQSQIMDENWDEDIKVWVASLDKAYTDLMKAVTAEVEPIDISLTMYADPTLAKAKETTLFPSNRSADEKISEFSFVDSDMSTITGSEAVEKAKEKAAEAFYKVTELAKSRYEQRKRVVQANAGDVSRPVTNTQKIDRAIDMMNKFITAFDEADWSMITTATAQKSQKRYFDELAAKEQSRRMTGLDRSKPGWAKSVEREEQYRALADRWCNEDQIKAGIIMSLAFYLINLNLRAMGQGVMQEKGSFGGFMATRDARAEIPHGFTPEGDIILARPIAPTRVTLRPFPQQGSKQKYYRIESWVRTMRTNIMESCGEAATRRFEIVTQLAPIVTNLYGADVVLCGMQAHESFLNGLAGIVESSNENELIVRLKNSPRVISLLEAEDRLLKVKRHEAIVVDLKDNILAVWNALEI